MIMSLMSRLIGWVWKLPPAETSAVLVEKNIKVPMSDGITLLTDHYAPHTADTRPTLLMRSVYTDRTRAGWTGELWAERGFHVLMQSGRGVAGSGGTLDPFQQEYDDGLATLEWLKQQDWFNGELVVSGASYAGFTAWATACAAGPLLKAMSTQITSADFRSMIYPGDALALEVWLRWLTVIHTQEQGLLKYLAAQFASPLKAASLHLPLGEADMVAFGKSYPFWREWLSYDRPGDAWWAHSDFASRVAAVSAPNHLVGGWYDFFLPQTIRAYHALAQAGHRPYLTIGPWMHTSAQAAATGIRESMLWLRAHLRGEKRGLREAPVRIFVMGAGVWRDLPSFPPPTVSGQRWYLHPGGDLIVALPPVSEPDHYRYDPGNPTPSVGGAGRFVLRGRGAQDNRSLEARPDVLTYTSASLDQDIEVIGPISTDLFVRSSAEHTDFFVRLTDVEPSGRSLNVCDGLRRLFPSRPPPQADGCLKVHIDLWPTSYRFRRGHRIRLPVSSGSFPRWARNLGSGEPLATATILRVASQQIYHNPDHPSAVILPIVDERQADQDPEGR
jgi:uncharacterized protein